jgi:hypothetical protein
VLRLVDAGRIEKHDLIVVFSFAVAAVQYARNAMARRLRARRNDDVLSP